MKNTKIRYIMMIILVIICFMPPVTAENSYSITEVSKYDFKVNVNDIKIHSDLTPWSEPDLKKTKENLRDAGWKSKFHKKNHDVTESVFQNELQQSDLHIHVGHGNNLPGIGGHIVLSDYLFPSVAQGKGGWVSANEVKEAWKTKSPKLWTAIHSCHVLETDQEWADVLKNTRMHEILGFGSTAYTTGHFLADFTEEATKQQKHIAEAWEYASLKNQLFKGIEPVKVRTIFKNIDQYKNDKLDKPSTNTKNEIVVCDMELDNEKVGKKQIKGWCKPLNSDKLFKFIYDITYSPSDPETIVSAKKTYINANSQSHRGHKHDL